MENENTNEKKKQKITILVGVVTLLIAVLGATYAYFQISTDTDSSNTTITGSTPPKSLVTLKGITSNLHLNMSASDMSLANAKKEYYATELEEKAYEESESDGTKTIAQVELTGGEATTKYSCTAKLIVTKVIDEDNADTMIEVLQSGDMILQFKGDIISEKLDLSELKNTGSKEYNLSFLINGNNSKDIEAYIKLINKSTPQNYLAGKKLNIDISTSDLKCDIKSKIGLNDVCKDKIMAECVTNKNDLKMLTNISSTIQGDMYRYQGAFPDSDSSEMPNWICFGTTDKEECTNENTGIDKYMYRIIGITPNGELYLLKETFLKEGSATSFQWHNTYNLSQCLGDACEWPNVDLYKRLNGQTSNGNPIFINNKGYEYMAQGTKWNNIILYHSWIYGDTNEYGTTNTYNGDYMYAIETGNVSTKRYWPDEGQVECSSSSPCIDEDYTWSKRTTTPTKIGLMYIHDIYYAYPGGNPGNTTNVANSWINYRKDGYNSSGFAEWLITRYGLYNYYSRDVLVFKFASSSVYPDAMNNTVFSVRPTFYLSPGAKIKSGNGTKSDPYILDVQE